MRLLLPEDRGRCSNGHSPGVAIDTVYKHMIAIPLEKKGNRDPFASRSLPAFARYVGHPNVIIQGDSEHALVAVIHDASALLTAATPRTSPGNSMGSIGAAERAMQAVEGMARTLRLDLLTSTNIAVGSDLPITSWMVRHAAWLLSHFQTGSAYGKTAYARQFERPYESPVLPFAERVMWKDPTLQPAKLKSSWGSLLGRSQTSNAHLIGTRVGIVVARTIRRLLASEREESNLVVAMSGTPVAGRPADAAAGDAPTVMRHAVEHREVIVVPANSGAPLQAVSAPSNPVSNLPKPTVAAAQPSSSAVESSHHPSGERVDSSGPGGDVPMKVAQAVEPTTKSHAPVEERDESLVPKRQTGRPATHCWPRTHRGVGAGARDESGRTGPERWRDASRIPESSISRTQVHQETTRELDSQTSRAEEVCLKNACMNDVHITSPHNNHDHDHDHGHLHDTTTKGWRFGGSSPWMSHHPSGSRQGHPRYTGAVTTEGRGWPDQRPTGRSHAQ